MSLDAKRKAEDDKKEEEPPEKKVKEEEDTSVDSQEDVLKVVSEETTLVILDARRDDEVLESGFIKTSAPGHRWVHVSCKRDEAPLLETAAKHMIPDKDTPIITYCRSGGRSGRAKAILKEQGYKTVVNAGGFGDLDWLQKAVTKEE